MPAMQERQEAQVSSLGGEDPLEEEMATHCSILAWKIKWIKGPHWLQTMGGVGKSWVQLGEEHSLISI